MRDETIDNKELHMSEVTFVASLVPEEEGLFLLRDKVSQEILGIAAVYVDDVFAIGLEGVVAEFLKFIGSTWSTKFTGCISRVNRENIRDGDLALNRVPELSPIGLQVQFGAEGKNDLPSTPLDYASAS